MLFNQTAKFIKSPVSPLALPLLVCWMASAANVSTHATSLPRSVLILDQDSSGMSAFLQFQDGFRAGLDVREAALYREKLDLNHFGGPEYRRLLETYLRDKYRDVPISVIVAFGIGALPYAIGLRTEGHSTAPIVFSGVADRSLDRSALPVNVTGRTLDVSLANFLTAARAVVPGLQRMLLLGDPLERQAFRSHLRQEFKDVTSQVELIDLTGLSMRSLQERIAALPVDLAIAYTTINIDGDGLRFIPREALNVVVAAANRPIVIDVASNLGSGAVGGIVVKPLEMGREVSALVSRILAGEDASQIPIAPSNAVSAIFDWNALQKWRVREAQLPSGSEILFRPPGVWERHGWQIVIAASVALLQGLLIGALLFEDRARRSAQSQSFQLMTELARRDRIATAGATSASIAHEIGQPLAAIVVYGTAGLRWLENNTPDFAEAKKALQIVVKEAHRAGDVIKGIRAMCRSGTTKQEPVDVDGLVQKVVALAEAEIKRKAIRLTLDFSGKTGLEVKGSEVQLQQVVQNVLLNAIEAMGTAANGDQALRVTSREASDGNAVIEIEDTGPGIAPDNMDKIFDPFFTTKAEGMGLGLPICRSIVEAHGGKLTVANRSPRGAIVQIAIPQHQATVS